MSVCVCLCCPNVCTKCLPGHCRKRCCVHAVTHMGDEACRSQKMHLMPWNWSYRFVSHRVSAGNAAWVPGKSSKCFDTLSGFSSPAYYIFYSPPHTHLERSLRKQEHVQSCHQPWGHCSMMDVDLLSKGWIKSFPAAAVLNWLANGATSLCLVQMNITSVSVKHWADKDKRFAASSVSTFHLCAGFTRKWSAGSVTWWSASKRVHKMPSSCCVHAVDSKTIFFF